MLTILVNTGVAIKGKEIIATSVTKTVVHNNLIKLNIQCIMHCACFTKDLTSSNNAVKKDAFHNI